MKDPRQRLRDIGDAVFAIATAGSEPTAAPEMTRGGRAGLYAVAAAGVALAAVAGALTWSLRPTPELPLRRFDLPAAMAEKDWTAIAPDGTAAAFFSDGHLYVRHFAEAAPRDLGIVSPAAEHLAWSPDGRSLAYVDDGTLRTRPAAGGPIFTVCRIPATGRAMGLAWLEDGTLVFSAWREHLYKVIASGGTPQALAKIDAATEIDFHEVAPLPGGRLLVALHLRADDAVRTEMLSGSDRRVFVTEPAARDLRYVEPGILLFRRIGENKGLWATRFSETSPDLASATVIQPGATNYSASRDGTLIIRSDVVPTVTLAWLTRDGDSTNIRSIPGTPIGDMRPVFAASPQGDRLVYVAGARPQTKLLVRDLATGADTRLEIDAAAALQTIGGSSESLLYPGWFPGGDRVVFTYGAVEAMALMSHRADGGGRPVKIVDGYFGRVSSDSKWFVWIEDDRGQGRVHYAPMNADGSVGTKTRLPALEGLDVRAVDLSPDGTLLAFSVREPSALSTIQMIEFPGASARWQVAAAGTSPRFALDGRELLFMSGSRTQAGGLQPLLMAIPLTTTPTVKLGVAMTLLSGEAAPRGFSPAPNGRILIARAADGTPTTTATLIQNWPALLKR